jgi:hypothetical protein
MREFPLNYSCYVLRIIGSARHIAYKRGILVSALSITPYSETNYRIQFPFGGELVVCVPQELYLNDPLVHLLAGIFPGGREEALANDWHPIRLRRKYDDNLRWKSIPITDLLESSPPMTLAEINVDVHQPKKGKHYDDR